MNDLLRSDAMLLAHPDIVHEPRNAVFLATQPGQRFRLSERGAEVLRHFDTPRRVSESIASLGSNATEFLEQLMARGLLVPASEGLAPSPSARAHRQFQADWTLTPGRYRPSSLLASFGLPPLPTVLNTLVESGDAMGDEVVCMPLDGLSRQWNPYCGQWYASYDPGLSNVRAQRWLGDRRRAAIEHVYAMSHELAHGALGFLGLCGLMGGASLEAIGELHRAGEGFAYLISDLEVPTELQGSGLLAEYWPAATEVSHAHRGDPLRALRKLGITSPEARAMYACDLYSSEGERPAFAAIPSTVDAEAADAFLTERRYAQNVKYVVTPTWNTLYWSHPEIARFLRDFVPRCPVSLRAGARPVETLRDLFVHWRDVIAAPSHLLRERPGLALRIAIQRFALKIAELLRAIKGRAILMPETSRSACAQLLSAEMTALESMFAPLSSLDGDPPSIEPDEIEQRRKSLIDELLAATGHPAWRFRHPIATGEWMDSQGLRIDLPAEASPETILSVLQFVRNECELYLKYHGEDAEVEALHAEVSSQVARVTADASNGGRARAFLAGLKSNDQFKLAYRPEWISTRRFVEPSIGFRFV